MATSGLFKHAAGVLAFALLGGAMTACPPRETIVEISPRGAARLLNACGPPSIDVTELCDGIDDACISVTGDPQACEDAMNLCDELQQDQADAQCIVPGLGRPISASSDLLLAARLVLIAPEEDEPIARDASACAPLALDCDGPTIDEGCASRAVNAALQTAIPEDGLGFEGLEDPEDALPVLFLYHDRNGDGEVGCETTEMFACGALDRPGPGDDDYDIVCASCQGGPAATIETAPCFTDCFLSRCALLAVSLEKSGL